jgi:N-acetylneuraminic acid mutarotase
MQKKSPLNCASVSPRALVVILVCVAACLLVTRTLPAFLRSEAPANLSQRTLTFAERVAYQHAIEDVYWRHRIWPKERPDPKPSMDPGMSRAQLEKKVADYLRKSQALEDYWQRPITGEQLQAEMDRMAKHTKQPEVLREVFEALGNDPFVIAECLARPSLAERLLTSWYAYDERIHSELKQRAEAELLGHPSVEQMKQLRGNYSEIELVKTGSSVAANSRSARHVVKLNSPDWDETLQKLVVTLSDRAGATTLPFANGKLRTQIKTGVLSSLQEDEGRFYVTAVIEKSEAHLKVATVSWLKAPSECWLAGVKNQLPTGTMPGSNSYTLPTISDGATCIDDTWTASAADAPRGRGQHTAVWTGSEMIVWGGLNQGSTLNTGDKYNPATDTWTITTTASAPEARSGQTAVWTGTEMIVWGGYGFSGSLSTGGRYNPATDSWTATNTANAPAARNSHVAIWTGSEMIIWGGLGGSDYLNTGGRYNPITNSWLATNTANAPVERFGHTAVWTGGEMIIWGGQNANGYLNSGGRYNPGTNSWTATSTTNAPSLRFDHAAIWSGNAMIVWGGFDGNPLNSGGKYNPTTNTWTATNTTGAPTGRLFHTGVWTDTEMIIWGGNDFNPADTNTGGRYNPSTDTWLPTSVTNAPSPRENYTALWTGNEMIVFGGGFGDTLNTGGRYSPQQIVGYLHELQMLPVYATITP